jgi:hypothetical protein
MSMPAPEPGLQEAQPFASGPAEPHFSLLRLSAGQRVAGVSVILAMLWLAVWWAL